MEYSDWKKLFFIAGITLISACNSTTPSQTTSHSTERSAALFQLQPKLDKPALQTLQAHQGVHPYLTTLFNDPATLELHPVSVNPDLISRNTDTFSVPLPDGKTIKFRRKGADTVPDGMISWYGDISSDAKQHKSSAAEVDLDPFNWISIVRHDKQLIGSIHVNGNHYRLESIGGDQHVLVKLDKTKLPPKSKPRLTPRNNKPAANINTSPSSEKSLIRLLIVTTEQSRAKYPNVRQTLQQILTETNIYYNQSDTNLTLELSEILDAPYSESGKTYDDQLDDLTFEERALWKYVNPKRDRTKSSLVTLFSTSMEYCGLGWLEADKPFAYSVFSCTDSTLAHEIGHNLGADHEFPDSEGVIPRYAYGYESSIPSFRTLMTTSHDVIPYFSNPRLRYQGASLGTEKYNDAARRFDERREIVENFYPSPVYPNIVLTLSDDSNYCLVVARRSEDWAMVNWTPECKEEAIQPKSASISKWSGNGTLCFSNLLMSTKFCYSGTYNGDFKISNIFTGEGIPSGITFKKTGSGTPALIRYMYK
ncbi:MULTISPECIES: M12 family metallo-peptidase [Pseudomonas]|uniref:Zinc-dependent metalloprotease n=1 Tax=Pseudomonas peradeniyensis TaxID=2745488 RepID=A0ABT2V4B1_9PSED|nr:MULTISPECIES: M12 family metallo-peptidase [Pseudomonas]MCU7236574.1 zinc-dependent metalloprotease [Pseudomonas peradeniyensis]MCU7278366.1 zinc-dependent metalloprotease [Pseudomonas peradeniyensis]QZA54772.1 zinc-dependent metalloprotease [Pseudomonas sp. 2hn]